MGKLNYLLLLGTLSWVFLGATCEEKKEWRKFENPAQKASKKLEKKRI